MCCVVWGGKANLFNSLGFSLLEFVPGDRQLAIRITETLSVNTQQISAAHHSSNIAKKIVKQMFPNKDIIRI